MSKWKDACKDYLDSGEVNVQHLYWPLMAGEENLREALEDINTAKELNEVFELGLTPEQITSWEEEFENENYEDIQNLLHEKGKYGFLCMVWMPVRHGYVERGYSTGGKGSHGRLIYFETPEEFARKSQAAVEYFDKRDREADK